MAAVFTWVVLPFLLSMLWTWLARRYALRRNLMDQPGERRSHSVATPRGGGIAIVGCMLLGLAGIGISDPTLWMPIAGLSGGLLLVGGIGWLDDHRPLSPMLRLGVHAMAGTLLACVSYRLHGTLESAALALVATMVLVNVWNFMDGINGLAASQAAIAACAFGFLISAGPWSWLAAALVAAICGFLPFNFPRARIFLGDVGSGALGYMLAVLLVLAWSRRALPLVVVLVPVGAFLVDAGFTLLVRMLKRERWWEPHVQHAYQAWARRLGGHTFVTLAYGVFSVLGVILLLAAVRLPPSAWSIAISCWYVTGILVWARLRKDVQLGKETNQ